MGKTDSEAQDISLEGAASGIWFLQFSFTRRTGSRVSGEGGVVWEQSEFKVRLLTRVLRGEIVQNAQVPPILVRDGCGQSFVLTLWLLPLACPMWSPVKVVTGAADFVD